MAKGKETKGGHKVTPDPNAPVAVPGSSGFAPSGTAASAAAYGGKSAAAPYEPDPYGFRESGTGKPANPKQYLGVPSPNWDQDEEGNWVLQPGYSRTVQNKGAAYGTGMPDWAQGQVMLTPKYYEGDEYSLMNGAGLSPETRAAVQARMAQAGLMPKTYNIGVWDGDSVSAFQQVLTYANQTTQDWQKALDDLVAGGELAGRGGSGGGGGPVFVAHLSNPDDIKKAYKEVRYQLLGGQFTDDTQSDAFVTTFQAQEMNAQRAAFNAAVGGGGTVEDAPSMGTSAESEIENTDMAGVQAKRYDDLANVLGSILGTRSPSTNAT